MSTSLAKSPRLARRRQVSARVAALFALSVPAATVAETWTVNSCDGDANSGDLPTRTGTLRFCIDNAATTGDTVDLSGLIGTCPSSRISLTTGSVTIANDSLRLLGPGAANLKIDASLLPRTSNVNSRVIAHAGSSTLTIEGLGITGGYVNQLGGEGNAGCIFSAGNVKLVHAAVSSCRTFSYFTTRGGGVMAQGYVSLAYSTVSGNHAISASETAFGGGVWAAGNASVEHSTISGNFAIGYGPTNAIGGGLLAGGSLSAQSSTLSGNTAASGGTGGAKGGAAYVYGGLTASSLVVSGNSATSPYSYASAGGLAVNGTATLQLSSVTGNSVSGLFSYGGGANVAGNLFAGYSTISGNKAHGYGHGGGLFLRGLVSSIATSTISGNVAYGTYGTSGGGGIYLHSGAAIGSTLVLSNSTISHNSASGIVGGLRVDSRSAKFYNSTIAFNSATTHPGTFLSAAAPSMAVTLQSTLMSNNTDASGTTDNDLAATNPLTITFNGGSFAPANNLVRVPSIDNLPPDTWTGICPLLGPLRDNGGPTWTHALSSKSAAIDTGNYVFDGEPYDQRGPASVNGQRDYSRVSGVGTLADIGAYEVQRDDVVFNAGFDGCL